MDLPVILSALGVSAAAAVAWWRERSSARRAAGRLRTLAVEYAKVADASALLAEERRILELTATGKPMEQVLEAVCLAIEHQIPRCLSSILILDGGQRLLHGAAPSLPEFYCQAVHGLTIGDGVGSCGTAAFRGEVVIVEDISADPKWVAFRELAAKAGLAACWSFPIFSSQGKVLGTFAQYHREPAAPSERDLEVCRAGAHLASVAIESRQAQAALVRDRERMDIAEKVALFGVFEVDLVAERVLVSNHMQLQLDFRGGQQPRLLPDWLSLVHPDDRVRLLETVRRSLPQDDSISLEARLLHRGGECHWYRSMGRVERAPDGTPLRIIGAAQDVTAEKEMLFTMELAKYAAEQTASQKSRFLANMSHEIRTPLNGIIGCISMLREMDPSQEMVQHLDTMLASGEALLHVVNDVLDFSKIEAGGMKLEAKPFELAAVLREVEAILAPQAQARGLELRVHFAPRCDRAYLGDGFRLRQVLLNLLSNAVKFTPKGSVTVEVGSSGLNDCGEIGLQFRVKDTGIGMSPSEIQNAFTPFTQANASTSRLFGGTGLGLSISRHLVQLMGGDIRIESTSGSGTTFLFDLNLPPVKAGSEQPAPAVTSHPPSARPMRILVAEDNPVNQKVAHSMLKRLGHAVDLVNNGREALDAAKSSSYDAILMDCQMPEMDGLEATRRIREEGLTTQIIAITANAFAEDRQRCLAAGMDAYMPKPITLDRLRELLDEAAEKLEAARS